MSQATDVIKYDARSFIINGKRELLIGGEFHYFRTPNELWEDRIVKMKRSGSNQVTTYIPWNWHEPVEGQERWTGDQDLVRFIELCKKRAEGVEDFEYMIGHTNIKQADDLEKACRKAFGKPPLVVFELGGVVSANTGPDTVALVYTGQPRN